MTNSLPIWTEISLSDRIVRTDFHQDDYYRDVVELFETMISDRNVHIIQLSTTKSSIEVLSEKNSGEKVLVWDTDCIHRFDGFLALIMSSEATTLQEYKKMAFLAVSRLTASTFLKSKPWISLEVMRLADPVMPTKTELTIKNEQAYERYRKLARIYILLHEIAHIVYSLDSDIASEFADKTSFTIQNLRTYQEQSEQLAEKTDFQSWLYEQGHVITSKDMDVLEEQIAKQLKSKNSTEEIWCDMFATELLVSWANQNGFSPQECVVVDEVLHLFFSTKALWQSFWGSDDCKVDWITDPSIEQQQNRANIRGLFMTAMSYQYWLDSNMESEDISAKNYRELLSSDTERLHKNFYERFNLVLGTIESMDQYEVLRLAEIDWSALNTNVRQEIIDEIYLEL